MRVAILIRHNATLDTLFQVNGIMQNAKFIYDILDEMCFSPVFIHFGDENTFSKTETIGSRLYKFMSYSQLVNEKVKTPLVLEVGATLNTEQRSLLKESCDSKIVIVRLGNAYMLDLEQIIYSGEEEGGLYFPGGDAIWISPHFAETKEYHESINRCPVSIMPFLWEPDFIEHEFANYKEVNKPLDVYVMEPNINLIKNALVPLCIISELAEKSPEAFSRGLILNSEHFKDKPFFLNNIIRNLPKTSSSSDKVFFMGRYSFDEVFQSPAVLLGFQMKNGLNYLYNEALYKGVPLVHNSPYLQDVGYYYPDFGIKAGVEALENALKEGYNQEHTEKNRKFLKQYSIKNREVQSQVDDLIQAVLTRK